MLIGLYRYDLPLIRPLSFFDKTISIRSGLLIRIDKYWGEICPIPYFSNETLEEAQIEALNWLTHRANNQDYYPKSKTVRFAIDCVNSHLEYNVNLLDYQEVSCRLLIGTPKQILFDWFQNIDNYPPFAKINVSQYSLKDELRVIKEICKKAPNIKLIIDAASLWTKEEALTIINHLSHNNIYFIEDPCLSIDDTIEISKSTNVPIAVDQMLQHYTLEECCKIPTLKAAIIKPSIIGNIESTNVLYKLCKLNNIEPFLGTSFESQIGSCNIKLLGQMFGKQIILGLNTEEFYADSLFKKGTVQVDEDKLTVIKEFTI